MATEITIDTSSLHDVKVARLDADMFNADDISGGTEGLTGSGNLNYLVLQSGQTNEAARDADPFIVDKEAADSMLASLMAAARPAAGESDNNLATFGAAGGSGDNNEGMGLLGSRGETFNADQMSTNSAGATSFSNLSNAVSSSQFGGSLTENSSQFSTSNFYSGGQDGADGLSQNGTNGNSGNNGNNGSNGNNGQDGHTPTIPVIIPEPGPDSHITIHGISDLVNANLDLLVNPVGNLLGGVNIDVTAPLGDILSMDDGLLPHPDVIISGAIGDTPILTGLETTPLIQTVEHIANNLVDTINPVLTDALPFVPDITQTIGQILDGLNGDSGLFVTSDINLPAIGGLRGIGDLAVHVPLTPAEQIIGLDTTHLSIDTDQGNFFTDGLQPITIGLTSDGAILPGLDTEITTADLLGSTIQAVQDIVQDVTRNGDIAGNVLPSASVIPGNLMAAIAPLTSIIDTVVGGFGHSGAGSGHDTDLTLNTGLGLGENTVLDQLDAVATLDPVENIIGDIDITANLDAHALDGALQGDLSGLVDIGLTPFQPEAGQNAPLSLDIGNGLGLNAPELGDLLSSSNPGDQDLGVQTDLGLGTPLDHIGLGVPLDPVEQIVGDIDIDTHLDNNIVQGSGHGDIGSIINANYQPFGQNAGQGSSGGDTDLTLNTGLNLGTHTILDNATLGVTLDHVENIIGDVDVGINLQSDTMHNLLSGNISGVINTDIALLHPEANQNGGIGVNFGHSMGTDISSWPQTTIGGVLDHVTGGTSIPDAVLPEPMGLVHEGLNLVHDTASSAGGGLAAVVGHHGGLFG